MNDKQDAQFVNCAKILTLVSNTSGAISKRSLLMKFGDIPLLKPILKHLYDPYTTTGIKDRSLFEALNYVVGAPAEAPMTIEDFIAYLTENNTGSIYAAERACMMYKWAKNLGWEARWLMYGIITKNLQIGVTAVTLNQLYGKDFIKIIGIMRGMHAPSSFDGIYIATEKIDGNRRIVMNFDDRVEIYTRSGKRDTGLVELEEQAQKYLPKGYVYDTECVAAGEFSDNVECRQASASLLNKGGMRTGVVSKIFDMMPITDYQNGMCRIPAMHRKEMIAKLFHDTNGLNLLATIQPLNAFNLFVSEECTAFVGLPILGIVHNMPEAVKCAQPVWDRNGEGLMLVEYMSPYEVSPNPRKTLLKIKATFESVVEVIDVLEGTNSNEGRMGAVLVKFTGRDGNEYTFAVGSGFTQYERDLYWQSPGEIVGQKIEVEHFGESLNKDGGRALNCPIFKRIVGDEER